MLKNNEICKFSDLSQFGKVGLQKPSIKNNDFLQKIVVKSSELIKLEHLFKHIEFRNIFTNQGYILTFSIY